MASKAQQFHSRLLHQFSSTNRESNVAALTAYFGLKSSKPFDGSFFETYSRQDTDPNRVQPADLVAVTLLSMEIRRESRSGISTANVLLLEKLEPQISRLLSRIPKNRELHTLSNREFERYLGDASPASRLFDVLRNDAKMHRVATYKLLARKRPNLLPIRDSVTEKVLGSSPTWWRSWHHALSTEPSLAFELRNIRSEAAKSNKKISKLSLLRVADIAIWNS